MNYRLYKSEKLFLPRLKLQRLSKSCRPLFKTEWLCMPAALHAGWNDQLLNKQLNKTTKNEESAFFSEMKHKCSHTMHMLQHVTT